MAPAPPPNVAPRAPPDLHYMLTSTAHGVATTAKSVAESAKAVADRLAVSVGARTKGAMERVSAKLPPEAAEYVDRAKARQRSLEPRPFAPVATAPARLHARAQEFPLLVAASCMATMMLCCCLACCSVQCLLFPIFFKERK